MTEEVKASTAALIRETAGGPFKDTALGAIPENWAVVPLGSLLRVAQYGLSVRGEKTGRYPILRMNCQESGRVVFRDLQFVELDEATFKAFRLNVGDLLFNRTNSLELVGRTAIFHGERDAVFASYLIRLAVDESKVVPDFLNYYLNFENTQSLLKGLATRGVSQSNISANRLKSLSVARPPVEEQRALAATLKRIQAAVEVQERIVAALKELKAATMAKLFREGLRGESLKQTEIGEIPESWRVVPLGEVLRLAQYGLSVRGERSGRYPMLRMNCQEDGRVIFRDLQFVDLDEAAFNAFKLRDGDLLFNRTNSFELVGRTAIFHGQRDAVFASYLIRLGVHDATLVSDFLNFYLNLESVQVALKSLATRGVSQSNISASKLKSFRVSLPPRDEQARIVDVLNRLSESLVVAMERRDILKAAFSCS